MSKLIWDAQGEKFFEGGVDHAVLYPGVDGAYPNGDAWNGITAINESPEGGDAQDFYADNVKYGTLRGAENFGGTIECYTYPDSWKGCDGRKEVAPGVTIAQQNRKTFGLSYRTLIGNDTEGFDLGYVLHLVYNATASPSSKNRSTINESPEAGTLSYEFKTIPVGVSVVANSKATSHLEIDSRFVSEAKMTQIENILYGTAATDPRLPLPDEVIAILSGDDTYGVVNYLTNVSNSNEAKVAEETYTGTLTAADGYTIANVVVTMGGVDITATAYTSGTGVVSIASVTGDIVIIATANAD